MKTGAAGTNCGTDKVAQHTNLGSANTAPLSLAGVVIWSANFHAQG